MGERVKRLVGSLFTSGFGLTVLCLLTASVVMLSSANPALAWRQVAWMGMGWAACVGVRRLGYRRWVEGAYLIYAAAVVLLVAVLIVGEIRQGAQRWLAFGALNVQPAEFAKFALVLCLARWLGSLDREAITRWTGLIAPLAVTLVPALLLVQQPDLGSGLLLIPIAMTLLWMAGCRRRHLVGVVLIGCALAPVAWHFLRDYQRQRLLVFLDPHIDPLGAGYTVIQSKIAIGSGELAGKGWLAGTQNQLNFLPERHTDFIFSVVGEEWGFVGAALLVGLFWWLIRWCFQIARSVNEPTGRLVAIGVASSLGYQAVINMGMAMGLLPVVGLPLPLVSYGGSSLVMTMAGLGLVWSVRREA